MMERASNVRDLADLRHHMSVFRDRTYAGLVLAGMLTEYCGSNAILLAIPAGGVPVSVEMARQLSLPLDLAVVSKILPPYSTESGYGAVAFDGTVRLNERLIERVGLAEPQVKAGIEDTRKKVERRVELLRGGLPFPDLRERTAILVDDGLASGFTMQTATEAVRKCGAGSVVVAVPTGHDSSVRAVAEAADMVYCANIRGGFQYAVADAYEKWYDVSESEARRILDEFRTSQQDAHSAG
jgi:predicted phosphoribosyltransferase